MMQHRPTKYELQCCGLFIVLGLNFDKSTQLNPL